MKGAAGSRTGVQVWQANWRIPGNGFGIEPFKAGLRGDNYLSSCKLVELTNNAIVGRSGEP